MTPTFSSDDETWRFLTKVFKDEVPEIASGIVEIRAVARKPGVGCKIAIYSYDDSVDGVGACVGPRGSRVRKGEMDWSRKRVDPLRNLWQKSGQPHFHERRRHLIGP